MKRHPSATHKRTSSARAGVLALILATALLGAGCGGSDGGDGAAQNGSDTRDSLSLQVFADPASLDLTRATTLIQPLTLLYNVYEPLVQISDRSLAPQPALAESWDVTGNGRIYTFQLREATFHDGTEFDADDVVYTFERNMNDEEAGQFIAQAYAPVRSVEAIDDRIVRVTLKQPSNQFLTTSSGIAGSAGVIVPKGTESEELQQESLGTGPFTVARYVPDDSLYLERFDEHWGDAPALANVRFRFIPDANATVNALEAGDIDGIATLTSLQQAGQLESNPQFQVVTVEGGPVWHLVFNTSAGPLADTEVRQAISRAIDQPGFIEAVQFGYGVRVCGWLPVTYPGYEEHCPYPYDADEARRLIEQAGAAGTSVAIKANPAVEQAAELVAAQLREVGIEARVQKRDDAGYFEEVFAGDFEATVIGYGEDGFFDIANCPPPYWNGFCNRDAARLVQQGDRAGSREEAYALYQEVNREIIDDAPSVELFAATIPMVLPADVTGFKTYRAQGEMDVRGLRFE